LTSIDILVHDHNFLLFSEMAVPVITQLAHPDIFHKSSRLLIQGEMKRGKTREAVELIRRLVDDGTVQEGEIYELSANFRLLERSAIR
jgi:hypothetical protein